MKNTFLWLIVLIVVVATAFFFLSQTPPEMSLQDARAIAVAPASECVEKGTVGEGGIYNANSKTWWIDFTPKPEFTQTGCNPACVVDTATKKAEINWRCTGAIPPVTYEDMLRVDTPLPNASVSSPLTISGEARGGWYFEASFPVELYDSNGKLLAEGPAQAQGDWMTAEYVPFLATLLFTADTEKGELVVKNDNPSGLPENAKEVRIPVAFVDAFSSEGNVTRNNPGQKPNVWHLIYERPGAPGLSLELDLNSAENPSVELSQGERVRVTGTVRGGTLVVKTITPVPTGSTSIKLYYYNPALDQGPGGVQCSSKGLVAVDRAIPKTQTPLRDSIALLLKGELTPLEKARGITTEFPLSGVTLQKASIQEGVATLTFSDPQNKTGGGSCRVGVLWAQIEATAKQFPTVRFVRFEPEELFQP